MMLAAALAVAGCGSASGVDPGGGPSPHAWSYPEHQYVADEVTLPLTEELSDKFAFDLDGNGTGDNRLGEMFVVLANSMGGKTPQDSVNGALGAGRLILLLALFARDLRDESSSNLWQFQGLPMDPPGQPTVGVALEVDPAGPGDAYSGGRIRAGVGAFGGDDATFRIDLPLADNASMTLPLKAARVEFTTSNDGDTLETGRAGGAITLDDLNASVIPAMTDVLNDELTRKCAVTATDECACEGGSGAEKIHDIFDSAPADCVVSVDEVQSNSLLHSYLTGDVTLADGTRALSLAFGFHAVRATFDHPSPPQ